jgi:hypothetical protein
MAYLACFGAILSIVISVFVWFDTVHFRVLRIYISGWGLEEINRYKDIIEALKKDAKIKRKDMGRFAKDLMNDWIDRENQDVVIAALRESIDCAVIRFEFDLREVVNRLGDSDVISKILEKIQVEKERFTETGQFCFQENLRSIMKQSDISDIKKRMRQSVKNFRYIQRAGNRFGRYNLNVKIAL